MTTYFISRHPGAIESWRVYSPPLGASPLGCWMSPYSAPWGGDFDWATGQGLAIDEFVAHLDPACLHGGDTVIGSLPVNLAAKVCAAGAAYRHLSLELPAELRGRELCANALRRLGAKIEPFDVWSPSQNTT